MWQCFEYSSLVTLDWDRKGLLYLGWTLKTLVGDKMGIQNYLVNTEHDGTYKYLTISTC